MHECIVNTYLLINMNEWNKPSTLPQDENSSKNPPKHAITLRTIDKIYKMIKLKQSKPLPTDSHHELPILIDEEKCLVLYRKNHDGTLCKVIRRREFNPLTIEDISKISAESTSFREKTQSFIEKTKATSDIPLSSMVRKPYHQSKYSSHIIEKFLSPSKNSLSPSKPKSRTANSTPLLNLYRQKYNRSPIDADIESTTYAKITKGIHWKAKILKPHTTRDLNDFLASRSATISTKGSKLGLAMRNAERLGLKSFLKNDAISDYVNVLPRIKNLEVLKGS